MIDLSIIFIYTNAAVSHRWVAVLLAFG